MRAAIAAACLLGVASAQTVPDQDYGYVDVRPGAHIFWWFYGANTTTAPGPREKTPLVLWFQGGPGAGGSGYGNFGEMGPLDQNLAYRPSTWLTKANLLFVDSPVGAGFSYVDGGGSYTTNNSQVAADVVTLLTAFFAAYPVLSTTPMYIFSESYGGKMTADTAIALLAAIDAGTVKTNFKGIEMGDSWISGQDDVDGWGPFLLSASQIDEAGAAAIKVNSDACDAAIAAGDWAGATNAWGATEGTIDTVANGVDFYNILCPSDLPFCSAPLAAARHPSRSRPMSPAALALRPAGVDAAALNALWMRHGAPFAQVGDIASVMNGPVRALLNGGPKGKVIPDAVTWGGQSDAVFSSMSGDFMRPVVASVDALLKGGRINVTVAEGALDLICLTLGARNWMATLTWPGMPAYYASPLVPINGQSPYVEVLSKSSGTLSMYYVQRAGHMLPQDNPWGSLAMMQAIIGSP